MDFTVTITDAAQLAGITWAREQYNAALRPPAVPIETDDIYVQWVMDQAAASYAQQQIDAQWRAAYEADKAGSR